MYLLIGIRTYSFDLVELHAYMFMLYVIRKPVFCSIVFVGYVFCRILLPIILNAHIYVFCIYVLFFSYCYIFVASNCMATCLQRWCFATLHKQ
jgi:hypothetical protein